MIERLQIRDFGVFASASVEFSPGLTAVTGETGAGKTMVLRGLGLLLGDKADTKLIKGQADHALVEIELAPSAPEEVLAAGGRLDDGVAICSRSIPQTGRPRSSIGGAQVASSVLVELLETEIAVHGQGEQAALVRPGRQRLLLDRFAGILAEVEQYREVWDRLCELEAELAFAQSGSAERAVEIERLTDWLAQYDRLAPQLGEADELRAEAIRLGNAEGLTEAASTALSALESEDQGAISALSLARRALEQSGDPQLLAIATGLHELERNSADSAHELNLFLSAIDAAPGRLDWVEERRAALKKWARDFIDVDAAIAEVPQRRLRLQSIGGGAETVAQLRAQIEKVRFEASDLAQGLHEQRLGAAQRFGELVTNELAALAMGGASVSFQLTSAELGPYGSDSVALGLQSHANAPWLPVGKGASGGELSRVMLAIEVVLAGADPTPTFIFDEIDAGIGGQAAIEVGRRLADLAEHAQVIVVTHLAAVAAFADEQVVISRTGSEALAQTVTGPKRVAELARMLAGESSSAGEVAEDLLRLAQEHRARRKPRGRRKG